MTFPTFQEEIEAQKTNWELGRLQALKEEEERRVELEEESLPYYTYSREESQTQVQNKRSKSDKKCRQNNANVKRAVNGKTNSVSISKDDGKEVPVSGSKEDEPSRRSSRISVKGRRSYIEMISDCLSRRPREQVHVNNHVVKESPSANSKSVLNSPPLSPAGSSSPRLGSPPPFSNPELVIRTRRSSAVAADETCKRDPKDGLFNGVADEGLPTGKNPNMSLSNFGSPRR